MKKIKVVLSGSGTRYPCFVGSLIRLAEEGYEVEEICGTSGGAIIAAGVASGFKINKELVTMVKEILPAKHNLIDYSLWSLFSKWGLIKGDRIEKLFNEYAVNTFGETRIPCHIVTTNVERRVARVFSTKNDPDMSLAKAVRASMSIPGVFAPVKIDGEIYVDGGMTANYLLDIFGTGDDVIGLRFGAAHKMSSYKDAEKHPVKNAKDFINANIEAMLEATAREHIEDAVFARTITLETKHGGLNFNMTESDVDEMIAEGWECTDKWLKEKA